jgi:hypothetical protein
MAYNPEGDLKRLGRWRVQRIYELAGAGEPDRIHGSLLVAIASRETNCRNIIGGGYFDELGDWQQTGVDRGLYQINEHYHANWLRSVPGCLSGEYAEAFPPAKEGGEGALPPGRVPGLTTATKKAIATLKFNCTYAESQGVDDLDVLAVAVAGWNGGIGSTVKAYKTHGDPDVVTTGKDYSKDVLARQKAIRRWVQRAGWIK